MNQTRPYCVNQMGKTHSKPLAARYGRGTAWARHAMCESSLRLRLKCDCTCAETRFRLSAQRTSPFKSAGRIITPDNWQASCAHQHAGFVLLVQACVLQPHDAYWLPTPFPSFPFTSPPVRHHEPSHFKRSLPPRENQSS
jgi:hypothetical protein